MDAATASPTSVKILNLAVLAQHDEGMIRIEGFGFRV
jgi:hypothetical protein